ncbi:unnamed protein product [Leptidea sinapis]|uniref:Gustatory receptor n=1 Tax=Leptidea sinapis TaxID=189913 RepID=A0A5E4QCN6_9NEOP|nr:unnamed protein product [Leptidea sinapis]
MKTVFIDFHLTDKKEINAIQKFIAYIDARPFKFRLLSVLFIDLKMPFICPHIPFIVVILYLYAAYLLLKNIRLFLSCSNVSTGAAKLFYKDLIDAVEYHKVVVDCMVSIKIIFFIPYVMLFIYSILAETDSDLQLNKKEENAIEEFIAYIGAHPIKFKAMFVLPMDAKMPFIILNICITYFIVVIQLTHLY